jgi:GT2 family glycosyltransferase
MAKAQVSVGFLHPGTVSTSFMYSLQDLLFYDAVTHQRITGNPHGVMGKQCGAAGIVDGRNDTAQRFLDDTAADWLFQIDADMSFEANIVERLIETAHAHDRPVVGGLAFAHRKDGAASLYGTRFRCVPTIYGFHEDDDSIGFVPMFDYPRNELVECAATGGACVLIHRSALETLRTKHGDVWFDTIRHPKGAHFSEDLSFCVRLNAAGIPVHVHTGIQTGHDKGGVFYDEAFYLRQQSTMRCDPHDMD